MISKSRTESPEEVKPAMSSVIGLEIIDAGQVEIESKAKSGRVAGSDHDEFAQVCVLTPEARLLARNKGSSKFELSDFALDQT
jgi:hypothetical protein